MKGIVFTELLESIEQSYGANIVDDALAGCELASGGSYTSIGTYHHSELVQILRKLSLLTQEPIDSLVRNFGRHLGRRFRELYPVFFESAKDVFTFLASVDQVIHIEVRKLYPDAELPSFRTSFPCSNEMIMEYRSKRPFATLAEGLILETISLFGESIEVERRELEPGDETSASFHLKRVTFG